MKRCSAFGKRQIFQFTPLREGRPLSATIDASRLHFNSRPSARGDLSVHALRHREEISIHAPPRGATPCTALHGGAFFISIHAPPRGATKDATGQDTAALISIHAPPRGTTRRMRQRKIVTIFQFTPLREGRRGEGAFGGRICYFNSRPSARGDKN